MAWASRLSATKNVLALCIAICLLVLASGCSLLDEQVQTLDVAQDDEVQASDVTRYGVQFIPDESQREIMTLVDYLIPDQDELPTTVRVPFTENAVLDWAGEMHGGAPEDDTKLQADTTPGEPDVLTMEASGSRTVRFEWSTPGLVISADPAGSRVEATYTWKNTLDGPSELDVAVQLAGNARDVSIVPEPKTPAEVNASGSSLHSLGTIRLAPGESIEFTISYTVESASSP